MDRSYAPLEKVHTNKSKETPITIPADVAERMLAEVRKLKAKRKNAQDTMSSEAIPAVEKKKKRMIPRKVAEELLSVVLPKIPKNGYVWRNHKREEIAPFRIVTSPSGYYYYYCKLFNLKRDTWTLAVFIHPGKSISLEVPVGSYELRYAVGDTWYGREHLFGPRTSYYKAEAVLHFQIVGNRVSGYEVQLYPQPYGNLRTRSISPNEWGSDEQGGE
ncbi:MAG: hypothetical protein ABIK39_05600 [candidate division WOR-3 bacterium]